MTYKELFNKYKKEALSKGLEENAIKILITEISSLSSSEFYLNLNSPIPNRLEEKIIKAITEYLNKKIPVQYILGYTYFYGLKLNVTNDVLIPRRETEELVDYIIKNTKITNPRILDIGTGSGAIALALKANIPNSIITACDISKKALEVAYKNAICNNLDITFIQSDIFSNVEGMFDIIVSNPPYIASPSEVDEIVLKNEPHLALFASNDGLYFYEEILKLANKYLNNSNMIIFEIPENKDDKLIDLVKKYATNANFEIIKDLQNKSRILVVKNNWR